MAPKVAEKAVKAPATKAPAAKKVVKKASKGTKKSKKAVESYKIYIYKVLKQVGRAMLLYSMLHKYHDQPSEQSKQHQICLLRQLP